MNTLCRDIMAGFHRVNRTPLDDSVIVKYEDLAHYLREGTAYAGQYILIDFGNYLQTAVIMSLKDSLIVRPIMDWQNEFIWETVAGSHYLMVYNYLKGKIDNDNQLLLIDDPFLFSILPLANLFANSFNDLHWMIKRQSGDIKFFVQPNFVNTSIDIDNQATQLKIYSHSNSYGRFATSELRLSIMPYVENSERIRLFVEANDYYSITRGDYNV